MIAAMNGEQPQQASPADVGNDWGTLLDTDSHADDDDDAETIRRVVTPIVSEDGNSVGEASQGSVERVDVADPSSHIPAAAQGVAWWSDFIMCATQDQRDRCGQQLRPLTLHSLCTGTCPESLVCESTGVLFFVLFSVRCDGLDDLGLCLCNHGPWCSGRDFSRALDIFNVAPTLAGVLVCRPPSMRLFPRLLLVSGQRSSFTP